METFPFPIVDLKKEWKTFQIHLKNNLTSNLILYSDVSITKFFTFDI